MCRQPPQSAVYELTRRPRSPDSCWIAKQRYLRTVSALQLQALHGWGITCDLLPILLKQARQLARQRGRAQHTAPKCGQ